MHLRHKNCAGLCILFNSLHKQSQSKVGLCFVMPYQSKLVSAHHVSESILTKKSSGAGTGQLFPEHDGRCESMCMGQTVHVLYILTKSHIHCDDATDTNLPWILLHKTSSHTVDTTISDVRV